jgi:hypothetical protein
MNIKVIWSVLALSLLLTVCATSVSGQVQRTFISGLGSDSNPCNRTAPCRTFGQALSQTNSGGEIIVLDSAGYGAVTITKSVSIIASPGVYAGTSVFSGDGIDINAGSFDTIILRGLTINNQGSSGSGIVFNTGGTLHVENCTINGFSSGDGLDFFGPGKLEVKDSVVRNNGDGISVRPGSGTATATIDQVRLAENSNGVVAREGSTVTVKNTTASGGSGYGFFAFSTVSTAPVQMSLEQCFASNNSQGGIAATSLSTGSTEVNVENCVTSGNGTGVAVASLSTGIASVRVSNSAVVDNNIGLSNNGSPAVILSRGNNTIEGNTTNTSGTIGSYAAK